MLRAFNRLIILSRFSKLADGSSPRRGHSPEDDNNCIWIISKRPIKTRKPTRRSITRDACVDNAYIKAIITQHLARISGNASPAASHDPLRASRPKPLELVAEQRMRTLLFAPRWEGSRRQQKNVINAKTTRRCRNLATLNSWWQNAKLASYFS